MVIGRPDASPASGRFVLRISVILPEKYFIGKYFVNLETACMNDQDYIEPVYREKKFLAAQYKGR